MITPNEKALIASIARTDAYKALVSLGESLIADWNVQQATGSSEFEYLRSAISRDARQEGIRVFLANIEATTAEDSFKIKR